MADRLEWIQDVTDDDFEKEVIERSHEVPVVVDFWAEWCGPCRVLGPVLEKLAVEGEGNFVLAKVNVDQSPRHAQAFGVRGIPAVMAFRNGELAGEFTGALPETAVRDFLKGVCPTEADRLVERAEELWESDQEQAEALYRKALGLDPGHDGAKVGLAETLSRRGEHEEASKLIEEVVPSGKISERVEQLRSELSIRELAPGSSEEELRRKLQANPNQAGVLVELGKLLASEGRYPEALESLLHAAEADRDLATGEAKDLMVDIFHVIGVRSELADEYRTKLSRLLY